MKKKGLAFLLTIAMLIVLLPRPVPASEFSDMPDNWSTAALKNAVTNGLLIGDNGKILPDDNLTRAQMAAIINRAFGASQSASLSEYTDVPANAWYYDEMAKAVQMKTFVGSGDKLYPDTGITREEVFVVLARAFKLTGADERALDKFSDKDAVSFWAKDGAASLVASGYIRGSYGKINPGQAITRAEFAQMMDNLLKTYIKTAGTYTGNLYGNVMIKAAGVTLKDLTISGDLIIGEGVGNGDVTLNHVTILGRTVIRSGSVLAVNPPVNEPLKIEDYFPIKENVRYVYEGMGNEYAFYEMYAEYTSETKVQQRIDNGGTVLARVLEVKDGKLTRLLSQGETYYRENLLDKTDGTPEILLMEPLAAGTTWTLADGRTRTITSTNTTVTTPSGSYKAIQVVTAGPYDTNTDYYAKGIGLVKSVFSSDGTEVSSSLQTIEENTVRTEMINFYYPNINEGKLCCQQKAVSFHTNDVTGSVLAQAYKIKPNDSVGKVFSPNTVINSMSLNQDNKLVLDLNAAFVTEMNAGALYEGMILQSVVNTFGQYYGVEEVILTIDQQPYASGHIEMAPGQSLHVDFGNTAATE